MPRNISQQLAASSLNVIPKSDNAEDGHCFYHLLQYQCGCQKRSEKTRVADCLFCSPTWPCDPVAIKECASTDCEEHEGYCYTVTEKYDVCGHVIYLPRPVRRPSCPDCSMNPLKLCGFKHIIRSRIGRCARCQREVEELAQKVGMLEGIRRFE